MSYCYDEACRLVKCAIAAVKHVQTLEACTETPSRKIATPLLRAYIPTMCCDVQAAIQIFLVKASYIWNDLH